MEITWEFVAGLILGSYWYLYFENTIKEKINLKKRIQDHKIQKEREKAEEIISQMQYSSKRLDETNWAFQGTFKNCREMAQAEVINKMLSAELINIDDIRRILCHEFDLSSDAPVKVTRCNGITTVEHPRGKIISDGKEIKITRGGVYDDRWQ